MKGILRLFAVLFFSIEIIMYIFTRSAQILYIIHTVKKYYQTFTKFTYRPTDVMLHSIGIVDTGKIWLEENNGYVELSLSFMV